jgi:Protein of unknown function (DUF3489)
MNIFTFEVETNNITAHATVQDAEAVANAERFRTEAGLAKLAANWPTARLVEIWNGIPGVIPVKKFKDRQTAVSRIWKAIQGLGQTTSPVTTQQADIAEPIVATEIEANPNSVDAVPDAVASSPTDALIPEPAAAPTGEAPQTRDVAAAPVPATKKPTRALKSPKRAQKANGSREGSKTAVVLELLKRVGGVTANELMATTGWQAHSIRGFLSGTIRKKMGLTVVSTKTESGERTYSIKA